MIAICKKCGQDEGHHPYTKSKEGSFEQELMCKKFEPQKCIVCGLNHKDKPCKNIEVFGESQKGCDGFYHNIKGKICPKCNVIFNLSNEIQKIINFHRGHNQGVMSVEEFYKHMWNLNKEFVNRHLENLKFREGHPNNRGQASKEIRELIEDFKKLAGDLK